LKVFEELVISITMRTFSSVDLFEIILNYILVNTRE